MLNFFKGSLKVFFYIFLFSIGMLFFSALAAYGFGQIL